MEKNKPNWVIDRHILESETDQGDFLPALIASGSDIFLTRYVPFADNEYGPESWRKEPTILYGSWNYINKCGLIYTPGAYGFTKNLDVNSYYNHVPNNLLLNGDGVFTTFGQLKNNSKKFFDLFNTKNIFVRPVSGFKTFTGFPVAKNEIEYELNSTMQLTSAMDDTYILIAAAKEINSEYRFLIVDGKVIDGSEYKRNGKTSVLSGYATGALKIAEIMAQNPWQPDTIYTCDVASTPTGYKIIELNSFACAGLYAMNKELVINAVNDAAMKEYKP